MQTLKRAFCGAALLLILCVIAPVLCLADMSFNASVDKTEVEFGENLILTLTLSQDLQGSSSSLPNLPRIGSIPNFDIAGVRSAQQTSFINGVGNVEIQNIYELVPQKEGKFVIPSLTLSASSGAKYSTKPIEITVLPAPAEGGDEAEEANGAEEDGQKTASKSSSVFFKLLLAIGISLGAIVILTVVFSALFASRRPASKPRFSDSDAEEAQPFAAQKKEAYNDNKIENAQIITESAYESKTEGKNEGKSEGAYESKKNIQKPINFTDEVNRLKREYSETNKEFYQKYFEIFQRAMVCKNSLYTESMTADEMLKKASSERGGLTRAACERLSNDIDAIIYAARPPARAFSAIDSDAREVLYAIIQ